MALIDFEGATVAPLGLCYGTPLDFALEFRGVIRYWSAQRHGEALHIHFLEVISHLDRSGGWRLAYTKGRPFQLLVNRLPFQIGVWDNESSECWVDSRLSWQKCTLV
jgi:hypothetical protein